MMQARIIVDDARDVWAVRAIDHVRQDLGSAVRGLRKSPARRAARLDPATVLREG